MGRGDLTSLFKSCKTTVHKAGLSTVGHLYNLVTNNVTKYPVLATYKILKITKKTSPIILKKNFRRKLLKFFFKKLEIFFVILRIL